MGEGIILGGIVPSSINVFYLRIKKKRKNMSDDEERPAKGKEKKEKSDKKVQVEVLKTRVLSRFMRDKEQQVYHYALCVSP